MICNCKKNITDGGDTYLLWGRNTLELMDSFMVCFQLNKVYQEFVVLTHKKRMDKHLVHIIVDLVLLDNLESTNSIKNKSSGVQLNQEIIVLTQINILDKRKPASSSLM